MVFIIWEEVLVVEGLLEDVNVVLNYWYIKLSVMCLLCGKFKVVIVGSEYIVIVICIGEIVVVMFNVVLVDIVILGDWM